MRAIRTCLLAAITMCVFVGCGSEKPSADTVEPTITVSSDSSTESSGEPTSAVTSPAISGATSAESVTTGPQGASESTFVAGDGPTASPSSVYPAGDIDPDLRAFIDLAVADLSSQLGIDPSGITTHSAVVVVWPDSSLGCAEKGVQYTQVQTDGAVIELSIGPTIYRYHAGGSTDPFLCSRPLGTPPTRLD